MTEHIGNRVCVAPRCGRPAAGGLCVGCQAELRGAVAGLPELLVMLRETATGQANTSRGGGARTKASEHPLPVGWDAADLEWAVLNTVEVWASHVHRERYGKLPARPVGPWCTVCDHATCGQIRVHQAAQLPRFFAALCGWLAGHVPWLAGREEAAAVFDEITSLKPFGLRAVDNREDRYAGPCTAVLLVGDLRYEQAQTLTIRTSERVCGADLRVRAGSQVIRCRECGAVYDAMERGEWITRKTADQFATAALIAQALSEAGYQLKAATIRKWAERQRRKGAVVWLTVACRVSDQAVVYRVGDIYDRLKAEQPARRHTREAVTCA